MTTQAAGRQWPPELQRALFKTVALDVCCVGLLLVAVLLGFYRHQPLLAAVLAALGLGGFAIVWVRFFRRVAAYQRSHGLR